MSSRSDFCSVQRVGFVPSLSSQPVGCMAAPLHGCFQHFTAVTEAQVSQDAVCLLF